MAKKADSRKTSAPGKVPAKQAGLLKGAMPGNLPEGTSPKKGIHITKVWDAIIRGRSGGYETDFKLLFITNGNPVNQFLNTNKAVTAMKTIECVVVHEQFMTATARLADILLPVNTQLERNDIIRPWHSGSYYMYLNKAIDSLYESKSDLEICTELAKRLGIEGYCDKNCCRRPVRGSIEPDAGLAADRLSSQGCQEFMETAQAFEQYVPMRAETYPKVIRPTEIVAGRK